MQLSDDDRRMAVRDYLTPTDLLEFIDCPGDRARIAWGAQRFPADSAQVTARRLPCEPEPGRPARWTPTAGGFRYEIDARDGVRSGFLSWGGDVHAVVKDRLTPVRYGALRQAVEAQAAHDAVFIPCPLPYRTPVLWRDLFYADWSRERAEHALRAAFALDAILPPARPQPSLF
ncbi:hypothetical protein [Streptomyces sp. NPDC047968]|uniref:hypothetical protein n=1 Tax=unclassified Streptomyces TaxID=2593676 RepID=UPI003419F6A2